MMKRYTITLPTPEQAKAMAIKLEGQEIRSRLWLMGVAWAIGYNRKNNESALRFEIITIPTRARNHFAIDTNSDRLMNEVGEYLKSYGCTTEIQDGNFLLVPVDSKR